MRDNHRKPTPDILGSLLGGVGPPSPASPPVESGSLVPEEDFQIATIQESQQSGLQETQHAGNLEKSGSAEAPTRPRSPRAAYTKVSYRLSDAAIEAIEDAKRILRRQYKLKVDLEEIAEAAILELFADLAQNQGESMLVQRFTREQES